jgi:hypothetical protein
MAETLSTFQAAKLYDVPPTRLGFLIAQGRIKAEKIDGKWAIDRQSLEQWNRKRLEWKAQRASRGAPPEKLPDGVHA